MKGPAFKSCPRHQLLLSLQSLQANLMTVNHSRPQLKFWGFHSGCWTRNGLCLGLFTMWWFKVLMLQSNTLPPSSGCKNPKADHHWLWLLCSIHFQHPQITLLIDTIQSELLTVLLNSHKGTNKIFLLLNYVPCHEDVRENGDVSSTHF